MTLYRTFLRLASTVACTTLLLHSSPSFSAASAAEAASAPSAGIDRKLLDGAVRPQDDLYAYVNGYWIRTTPFPPDKAYIGVFEQLHERTQERLRGLVEEAANHSKDDADAARIGDLYASFMDESAIDRLGLAPLKSELNAIDTIADRPQLAAAISRLARLGARMPVDFGVGQDDRDATRYVPFVSQAGLGLPDRDYYLKPEDNRFAAARARYLVYMEKLLTLAGAHDTGEASPKAVLALEAELAKAQWDAVMNRDAIKTYNKVATEGMTTLAPGFDWPAWLATSKLSEKTPDLIVRQPSYLKAFAQLAQTAPLPTWKAYLKVRLLDAYAPLLPNEFVTAHFGFNGRALRGTQANRPRWQRGVALVNQSVGEILGKRYVERYFGSESLERVNALVANVLAAYQESIAAAEWMTPATREAALAKLAKFNTKLGHPKHWRDYASLEIKRDDLIGNVKRARAFEDDRQLAKLGRPIDRDEWSLTPQTVNAYYDASLNEIVFPAAILQPPLFDANADEAVNYGAIGAIIGHEISHGFDDQGSQYDGDGNLHDWWTEADKASFAAKTQALVAQYDRYVAVAPDYHVNGRLTLGENIADNAGLEIAWKAYQKALGSNPPPLIDGMSWGRALLLRLCAGLAWKGSTGSAAGANQDRSACAERIPCARRGTQP